MCGRTQVWMCGCKDLWIYGYMDLWVYGCIDIPICGCNDLQNYIYISSIYPSIYLSNLIQLYIYCTYIVLDVWTYGWMYACFMDVWMYGCMHIFLSVCTYVCIDACMHACIHVCLMYRYFDVYRYRCAHFLYPPYIDVQLSGCTNAQ